jgi:hypothetical protein
MREFVDSILQNIDETILGLSIADALDILNEVEYELSAKIEGLETDAAE